jgi:MFS family permease
VVLGAVAGATAYGEGALSDWGALHLREQLHAAPALAAAGYAGFSSAMAIGRLTGGHLVAVLGERRLLVGGSLLAAVGALAAVMTSSLPVALGGFVLVGLGLANVFPLAIARAGALGGPSGVAGPSVRRPVMPGWAQPVLFGRRPVAVVLAPATTRVRRGTGSYLRDLKLLEVN